MKLTSYALTQFLLCIELKIMKSMLSGHLKCIFEGFPVPAFICDFELLRFIILMYAQSCVLKMGNISLLILCMFIILLLNVFGLLVYFFDYYRLMHA